MPTPSDAARAGALTVARLDAFLAYVENPPANHAPIPVGQRGLLKTALQQAINRLNYDIENDQQLADALEFFPAFCEFLDSLPEGVTRVSFDSMESLHEAIQKATGEQE